MERDPIVRATDGLPRGRRLAIARELRAHLDDASRELEDAGWRTEDARREAAARLGDGAEIAAAFEEVYRPSRRSRLGLALVLATGMVLGAWGVGGSLASAGSPRHHAPVHPARTHSLRARR